jgi:RNA polymerase sigma-70 factor (ECF subfamily)
VRLHDTAAFDELFQRYYDPLLRILYRMLGDEALAEEMAQEAFVALYSRPPAIQGDDDSLRPWLYRVALNQGYNTLRAERRAHARAVRFAQADQVEQLADPEAEAVRLEERERVRATLAALPARQAKLLLLRQEEGLKYAEIAAILEVAPGSVGALLVRAERAFQLVWNHLDPEREGPTSDGGSQP